MTPRAGPFEPEAIGLRATKTVAGPGSSASLAGVSSPMFRYEPLPPSAFPVGRGPFRARGLAYAAALDYVDKRLPGGRAGFLAELGAGDPYASFYDQIFVVTGDYDVSPLLRLYVACARRKGVLVGRFIQERSRWSANANAKGMWKPMMKSSSAEEMASRLPLTFNRYFPPCTAEATAVQPGRFACVLSGLPASMTGLYTSSTTGFVGAALELAGAMGLRFEWAAPEDDGDREGIPVERARFAVTWGLAAR